MPLSRAADRPRRPVVALLTDFGVSEPFVGLVKARVLEACPDATLVDLTHELPPFAVAAASFWLERSLPFFPAGTVFLCVVDPGVGTDRRILLVESDGHLFLAPDNGLLARVAGRPGAIARAIGETALAERGLGEPSATFHGRDLFAPLAGRLAAGTDRPEELGVAVTDWLEEGGAAPRVSPSEIWGQLLFADRFGNYFSNIQMSSLADWKEWEVRVAGRTVPWVRTYGEGSAGDLVALENAFGVIEVARVSGSAAAEDGFGPGTSVEVRRRR